MVMDRQSTVRVFRARLDEGMRRAGYNRSQLAKRAGVDRSTLSQLLSAGDLRMPRADTVAAIAMALNVSLDWLLGLSGEIRGGAAILNESLQITPRPHADVDENLHRWHEEAAGCKIRYVPSSLPDLAKTDAVIQYEFRSDVSKTPDQALAASQGKLAYSRLPETDMEICVSQQSIQGFARGEGIWSGLDATARSEQLERMTTLTDELYPGIRMYLFDGHSHYSVPYTIFGPLRAAIFVGQMYFVFNTTEHVRVLTRHFDDLIRAATVQAHETPDFLGALRREID
jgi:transcriptional regulator with XRE-family HTH domain